MEKTAKWQRPVTVPHPALFQKVNQLVFLQRTGAVDGRFRTVDFS